MSNRLNFTEIASRAPTTSGVYEIYFEPDVPLKVGMGRNLRTRLMQHGASRDSGLRLKPNGDASNPDHMRSKASVLAKHLYYDQEICPEYDLKTQIGRKDFLQRRCYILIWQTPTAQEARDEERRREKSARFRYVGKVEKRPNELRKSVPSADLQESGPST